MMESPDAAQDMPLSTVEHAIAQAALPQPSSLEPIEIGPLNSLMPLLAAALDKSGTLSVINGDGAGRAVSIIKVATHPALADSPGINTSFANLLRSIGYAGALNPA